MRLTVKEYARWLADKESIKLGKAYEKIAKEFKFKDWNTMSASIKNGQTFVTIEVPDESKSI